MPLIRSIQHWPGEEAGKFYPDDLLSWSNTVLRGRLSLEREQAVHALHPLLGWFNTWQGPQSQGQNRSFNTPVYSTSRSLHGLSVTGTPLPGVCQKKTKQPRVNPAQGPQKLVGRALILFYIEATFNCPENIKKLWSEHSLCLPASGNLFRASENWAQGIQPYNRCIVFNSRNPLPNRSL